MMNQGVKLVKSGRGVCGGWLLLILVACRLPWIHCDIGVPPLWDYGYFCTDEGGYTLEGRYLYLTGSIFDPVLMGSGTFMVATLQHFLCFLSYKCFGLNDWAHRVPVFLVSVAAWMAIYMALSRRTVAWLAALVVGVVSCNPVSLVYERTASTDILMGGLVVLAYVFALRRSLWNVVVCAVFMALAYNAKVSCVGIIPLIGMTVISSREQRWLRGLLFATSLLAFVVGSRYALNSYIGHLAAVQGVAPDEMLKILWRGYGIPSLPGLENVVRSYSSFPRWTNAGVFGVGLVLVMAIPFLALVGRLFGKAARWDRRASLYLGMIIYMAAVDVGRGGFYVRHYVPLFFFIPILIFLLRTELAVRVKSSWRRGLGFIAISLLAFEAVFWLAPLGISDPRLLVPYFCNHHNAPAANLWAITARMIIPAMAVLGLAAWGAVRWEKQHWRRWCLVAGIAFVVAHFGSTGWPLFRFGLMDAVAKENVVPLVLLHVLLISAGAIWLFPWKGLRHWKAWYTCVIATFVVSWLINPYWRMGTMELMKRKWERRNMAKSLEQLLPANAVVLGDQSAALLIGSRLDTVPFVDMPDEQMIAQIDRIERSNRVPFVVLDKIQNQQWQALVRNASRVRCTMIAKIMLPAHHNGEPIDCYLARLECIRKK